MLNTFEAIRGLQVIDDDNQSLFVDQPMTKEKLKQYLANLQAYAPDLLIEKNHPNRPILKNKVPDKKNNEPKLESVGIDQLLWIVQLYLMATKIPFTIFDPDLYSLNYCVWISEGLVEVFKNLGLESSQVAVHFYWHEQFEQPELIEIVHCWSDRLNISTGIAADFIFHYLTNQDAEKLDRRVGMLYPQERRPEILAKIDVLKKRVRSELIPTLDRAVTTRASWIEAAKNNRWHKAVVAKASGAEDGLVYFDLSAAQFHPGTRLQWSYGNPYPGLYHPVIHDFVDLPAHGIFPYDTEEELMLQMDQRKGEK